MFEWCGSQGSKPRSGSRRCHACTVQYVPFGALHAATSIGSAGPSYGAQRFLNVAQYLPFRYLPQPPA